MFFVTQFSLKMPDVNIMSVSFKEICSLLTYLDAFKVSTLSLVVCVLWVASVWFDLYSSWIWFTELLKTISLCLLTNIVSVILGSNFNMLELCHHVPHIFLFHFFQSSFSPYTNQHIFYCGIFQFTDFFFNCVSSNIKSIQFILSVFVWVLKLPFENVIYVPSISCSPGCCLCIEFIDHKASLSFDKNNCFIISLYARVTAFGSSKWKPNLFFSDSPSCWCLNCSFVYPSSCNCLNLYPAS